MYMYINIYLYYYHRENNPSLIGREGSELSPIRGDNLIEFITKYLESDHAERHAERQIAALEMLQDKYKVELNEITKWMLLKLITWIQIFFLCIVFMFREN